jgi:dTDP-4-dehydrorhamnose reductase
MKILVTGSNGQVAHSLVERTADLGIHLQTVGRPDLDLTDVASVRRAITSATPDIVVSAAAYTAVDQAEDEPNLARAVNAVGAGAVADAAREVGAAVIHLSTDYVFSGASDHPYRESDDTGPCGIYGRTKLAGDEAVARANPRHVILRTAWVYSPFGRNFVKTMLGLARMRDEVRVVSDQWGNPTSALDIAEGVLHVARRLHDDPAAATGVFHLVGTGETNWSGLAEHVFATSRELGGPSARVIPIATSDYPTKATRPANSRLVTDKLLKAYAWQSPNWQQSCRSVVSRLLAETEANA